MFLFVILKRGLKHGLHSLPLLTTLTGHEHEDHWWSLVGTSQVELDTLDFYF